MTLTQRQAVPFSPKGGARVAYTVGEVASIAGVSVRTLHHYDSVGVLRPSARSESGYRLYTEEDLERLQQVLIYRELEFSLEDIARIVNDKSFDRLEALVSQRELVERRLDDTRALLALLEKTIAAARGGIRLSKEEMFEVFGDFDPSEYEQEAAERWGDTDAYRESARRAGGYSKEDWERFKSESDAMSARMVELFDGGVAPDAPEAMDVAEQARRQIDEWFYPCSPEMHVCLGEMYVSDPRFTAFYDKQREGLAQWLYEAIRANAERRS